MADSRNKKGGTLKKNKGNRDARTNRPKPKAEPKRQNRPEPKRQTRQQQTRSGAERRVQAAAKRNQTTRSNRPNRLTQSSRSNQTNRPDKTRDWSTDLVNGFRNGGDLGNTGVDKITDLLVDKKAWRRTGEALVDGPGGKEVRGRDLANMALDATLAIPGAGLVGGAARVAARGALKAGARKAGAAAAAEGTKLTGLAAQVAARKAAPGGARRLGDEAAGTAARGARRGAAGAGSGTAGRRRAGAEGSKLGSLLNEAGLAGRKGLESTATRATRARSGVAAERAGARLGPVGNGTRVGFNQSKKRVLANTLLAGGANVAASAYNDLVGGSDKPSGSAAGGVGADGIVELSGAGGAQLGLAAPGFYLVDALGESTPLPDAAAQALAASYENMGGSPNGEQVIYLGR